MRAAIILFVVVVVSTVFALGREHFFPNLDYNNPQQAMGYVPGIVRPVSQQEVIMVQQQMMLQKYMEHQERMIRLKQQGKSTATPTPTRIPNKAASKPLVEAFSDSDSDSDSDDESNVTVNVSMNITNAYQQPQVNFQQDIPVDAILAPTQTVFASPPSTPSPPSNTSPPSPLSSLPPLSPLSPSLDPASPSPTPFPFASFPTLAPLASLPTLAPAPQPPFNLYTTPSPSSNDYQPMTLAPAPQYQFDEPPDLSDTNNIGINPVWEVTPTPVPVPRPTPEPTTEAPPLITPDLEPPAINQPPSQPALPFVPLPAEKPRVTPSPPSDFTNFPSFFDQGQPVFPTTPIDQPLPQQPASPPISPPESPIIAPSPTNAYTSEDNVLYKSEVIYRSTPEDVRNMLAAINNERLCAQNGSGPLELDDDLSKAAQLQSDTLVGEGYNKSNPHIGIDGSRVWDRVSKVIGREFNTVYDKVNENLFITYSSNELGDDKVEIWIPKPEFVVEKWMCSPDHKDTQLGIYWTHIGLAYAEGTSKDYKGVWTAVYAEKSSVSPEGFPKGAKGNCTAYACK